MTNEKNRNFLVGRNIEYAIKTSIVDRKSVIDKIKQKFNIKGELENASLAGIYGDKSDLRIAFTCGHYVEANIKGYKLGFNQLTRASVARFCEIFGLNNEDKQELENIVVAKSRSPKNPLFSKQNWDKWGNFFRDKTEDL